MCGNVCNFGFSNFAKNGPLQLISLCDFTLKVAVNSNQPCLICATKILSTLQKVSKMKWLRYKLQRFSSCAN